MQLFCAEIQYTDRYASLSSRIPKQRAARTISSSMDETRAAHAYSLLAFSLLDQFPSLPEISLSAGGKPYFSKGGPFFSLSHTKTHVLCAVDTVPVGVDIETIRRLRMPVYSKILSTSELAQFTETGSKLSDFFKYWVLKESCLKLLDIPSVPLKSLSFSLDPLQFNGAGVYCALFDNIAGCLAAVCSESPFHAPGIRFVSVEELISF